MQKTACSEIESCRLTVKLHSINWFFIEFCSQKAEGEFVDSREELDFEFEEDLNTSGEAGDKNKSISDEKPNKSANDDW